MRRKLLVIFVGLWVSGGLYGGQAAEAQTYNLVWILDASASPNPFQAGAESTTITIDTFEFAQWFYLFPTTMVRPTIVVQVADRWFIAQMVSEWYSQIGFWGWWIYWWYVQDGMWTHQVIWDGKDLQGNLVPPGPYLATITVYAGGAWTVGSVLINVESPLSVAITSPPEGATIPLGVDTTFTAEATPSQYTSQVAWSGGEIPPTGTGGSFTTLFTTGGLKMITASVTAGTQSANDSVQVNVLRLDYLLVTPAKVAVPVGRTAAFTAQGYNNGPNGISEQGGGDDIPLYVTPNWSVTGEIGTVNPSTQSPTTTFQAVATLPEGKTKQKGRILATAGTVVGEADVEVYLPRLGTVEVSPATAQVLVGESLVFATSVFDQEGKPWDLGGLSYQWFVNDIPLAGETTSTLTYLFSAKGKYNIKVEVSYQDQVKAGKATVEVVELGVEICEQGQAGKLALGTLAAVQCIAAPPYVCVGQTVQLTATGTPPGGTFAWSVSDTSIATIGSTSGLLTASAPGIVTVYVDYTYQATFGTRTVRDQVQITILNVQITRADITQDLIQISLGPNGHNGVLTLTLVGAPGSPDYQLRKKNVSAGTINESFDIPKLPNSEFVGARATWKVQGFECSNEYNYHFRVLGDYNHTQYNTPNEADCTGTPTNFCYTTGTCLSTTCNWITNGVGKSNWLSEVAENGSGYHSTMGYISLEGWCQRHGYPSPPECNNLLLLRDVTTPCPSCLGQTIVANETAAVKPGHPYLTCGDRVYVYQVGVRTVADTGGGLREAQLLSAA